MNDPVYTCCNALHFYTWSISDGHITIGFPYDRNITHFLYERFYTSVKKGIWQFFAGTYFDKAKAIDEYNIKECIVDRTLVSQYDIDFYSKDAPNLINLADINLKTINNKEFGTINNPAAQLVWRTDLNEYNGTIIAKNDKLCNHQWINVGFSTIKMVCKHCNIEQEKL